MPNLTISPHWEGGCDWKEKSRPIGRQVGCFFCMTSPSFFIVGDSYLLGGVITTNLVWMEKPIKIDDLGVYVIYAWYINIRRDLGKTRWDPLQRYSFLSFGCNKVRFHGATKLCLHTPTARCMRNAFLQSNCEKKWELLLKGSAKDMSKDWPIHALQSFSPDIFPRIFQASKLARFGSDWPLFLGFRSMPSATANCSWLVSPPRSPSAVPHELSICSKIGELSHIPFDSPF